MKRIAILGECMIELNGTPFGPMQQTYGGDSLNTAVYLARTAGDSVAVDYISVLGTDALSEGMIRAWQAEGIHTEQVLRDPARQPGLYLIQLDDAGERTFLYWRNQSAARYLVRHPNFPAIAAHLASVDMIYLSGISLAILPPEDRQLLIEVLGKLKQRGVQIAFDTNYRPALWESADEARLYYAQLFALTELALVTNDDEQALWGDECEEDTLARLQAVGVKKAVVKLGPRGSCYENFTLRSRVRIDAQPVAKVVDTTSAGDAFNAGFLAGVITRQSPAICSEQGHRLAGTVIQHRGAIIPASATSHLNFNVQPRFIYTKEVQS
ncbi:sugar kinase [Photobacterium atrarenae]|uniref:Sugar kinase n=1 Tax=Photobacterium atrarenae TaxID=865757 RepID=A0ABY5GQ15_9GAMM|nr:sugar kinase [Photobacterium atrarenae]UTV31008.1 sugar kinase [Photobacterium atrarenae]